MVVRTIHNDRGNGPTSVGEGHPRGQGAGRTLGTKLPAGRPLIQIP